mgnify:CR=1 FL=1
MTTSRVLGLPLALALIATSGIASASAAIPKNLSFDLPALTQAAGAVTGSFGDADISYPDHLFAPREEMNWDGDHTGGPGDVKLRFSLDDHSFGLVAGEFGPMAASELALSLPGASEAPLAFPATSGGTQVVMSTKGPVSWFLDALGKPEAHLASTSSGISYRELKSQADALLRNPPRSLRGASELACIAVAIYHEARDQSTHGQLAVASVIQQRARVPGRWGDDACDVVRPVQFSFMTSRYGFPRIREADAWANAVSLAMKSLIDGPLPELRDADHYHANYVRPKWRHQMERVGQIGTHIFYRDPSSRPPDT